MEFNRWQTLAALVCSLSLQAVALAQQPEDRATIAEEALEPNDEKNLNEVPEKPVQSQTRTEITPPDGGIVKTSKITITLPNGETRVLAVPQATPYAEFADYLNAVAVDRTAPKFVIGVSLSEVPDSLRAHVTLPEGVRVMAGSVFADSPAAQAGLQQYDLLLKSGGQELKSPQDLQEIVDASEGKPVSITIQRMGEQKSIDVTPIKREDAKFASHPGGPLHMIPGGFSIAIPEGTPLGGGLLPEALPPGAPVLPPGVNVYRWPVPGPMVPQGNPNPVQVPALADSIRHLAEQVEHLKGSIDRLEQQQDREKADDKK